jgi:hypothetical protein
MAQAYIVTFRKNRTGKEITKRILAVSPENAAIKAFTNRLGTAFVSAVCGDNYVVTKYLPMGRHGHIIGVATVVKE